MDLLAAKLATRPGGVRRRNLIPPEIPVSNRDRPGVRLGRLPQGAGQGARASTLRTASSRAGRGTGRRPSGRDRFVHLRGARFVRAVQRCARLFGMNTPGFETATVRFLPSGKVLAYSGSVPSGQGHATAWAQILADQLQIPIDDVDVHFGDTGTMSYGVGTFGSRSAVIGGGALKLCADKIHEKARFSSPLARGFARRPRAPRTVEFRLSAPHRRG